MTGRLLLVGRLLARDLRRRPVDAVLLLIAVTAATATLTLGLALRTMVADPYRQTRAATAGPDVVAEPGVTGADALAALAPVPSAPGVTAYSGPFPLAYTDLTAGGARVRVVAEGRDGAPAAVDQPAVTDGTWVRPGGVVVERTFATTFGMRVGDTVTVNTTRLRVTGIAVSAARAVFPAVGWHVPDGFLVENGGLVWVDRGDIPAIAGTMPLSYALKLQVEHQEAFIRAELYNDSFRGGQVHTWQEVAETNNRLTRNAQTAMYVGSTLLAALAVTGVAGLVAGRVIARRRRVGVLKAVGAGPAMIAAVQLAEYLVLGLVAAGAGLAVGWIGAPLLFRPSVGFIAGLTPWPPLRVVAVAV
ncbi:FtsX-like permease family protein, partial [Dactylosporangium sp. NPDC005572]|uniref:ABC transporter permease n=1 Tax=Dactylosporangium sp. NPDC005572 TaxID=3156889 RepID=UPI0033B87512